MTGNVFIKLSNINFHANPFIDSLAVTRIITDLLRDLTGDLQGCEWFYNESRNTC